MRRLVGWCLACRVELLGRTVLGSMVIAVFLKIIALRPYVDAPQKVSAQARFDHVYVAATGFLYKGRQGLLLMDRRNGNVWFFARRTDQTPGFGEPEFLMRIPLEKLDQAPPSQGG